MAKNAKIGAKKPRKPKTKNSAPGAKGAAAAVPGEGHNGEHKLTSDEERDLFLNHRTAWNEWQAKVKAIEVIERDVKAALKADGFTVKQFQLADQLLTVKGEKRVKEEVVDRLKVARWLGLPFGAQLDLFADGAAAETGAQTVDGWYAEGHGASAANKPRKPPGGLAHGSEEHNAWLAGYDAHQAELGKGFKAPREGDEPEAGERVTRSEFKRRLGEMGEANDGAPPGSGPH